MKLFKKTGKILFAMMLASILFGCSATATYDQARSSYQLGDYQRSFKLLETLARKGDARSQYGLGYLYYHGLGVPKDEILGVAWMTKSACRHDPKAVCALKIINTQTVYKADKQEDKREIAEQDKTDNIQIGLGYAFNMVGSNNAKGELGPLCVGLAQYDGLYGYRSVG